MAGALGAARTGAIVEIVTHERLLSLLLYEPETGVFTWKVRMSKRVKAGAIAGYKNGAGYWNIGIDEQIYEAHRLAWFYVNGTWPNYEIDHKNNVRTDNWIDNLRDVPHMANMQNMASSKDLPRKTGTKQTPSGKWQANVKLSGKKTYLGLFLTQDEAHAAYLKARFST